MRIFLLLTMILAAVGFAACQPAAQNEAAKPAAGIKQVSVADAKPIVENASVQFIDVRTAAEYEGGRAPRAENLPLDELEKSLAKLDREKPVYVICQTGRRSQMAAEILEKNGFKDIYNIEGGTSAWTEAGFPVEK